MIVSSRDATRQSEEPRLPGNVFVFLSRLTLLAYPLPSPYVWRTVHNTRLYFSTTLTSLLSPSFLDLPLPSGPDHLLQIPFALFSIPCIFNSKIRKSISYLVSFTRSYQFTARLTEWGATQV